MEIAAAGAEPKCIDGSASCVCNSCNRSVLVSCGTCTYFFAYRSSIGKVSSFQGLCTSFPFSLHSRIHDLFLHVCFLITVLMFLFVPLICKHRCRNPHYNPLTSAARHR